MRTLATHSPSSRLDPGKPGRLLAINFGGIGDEILFFPTLDTIRETLPGWHISLLLEPRSRSAKELTESVDDVLLFDIKKRPLLVSDLMELLFLIKKGRFDAVVSSGSSPMVSALLFLSGIPHRVGYDSNTAARLLLSESVFLDRDAYAARMYQELAFGLARLTNSPVNGANSLPLVKVSAQAETRMNDLMDSLQIPEGATKILIHPGTSRLATQKGILKSWPVDSWLELIKRLGALPNTYIVLAGGPDDQDVISELQSKCSAPYLVSTFGKTKNLSDLAALMELSDLIVCVDSAPMHVGVGLNRPLVALFGPTDPAKLLPDKPHFKAIWDRQDGNRSMFDRKGVNINVGIVYDAIYEQLKHLK
jgi:ADP-heptose:LPS heptosyltransferase